MFRTILRIVFFIYSLKDLAKYFVMNTINIVSVVETLLTFLSKMGKRECHVTFRKNSTDKNNADLFSVKPEDYLNLVRTWNFCLQQNFEFVQFKSGKNKLTIRMTSEDGDSFKNLVSDILDNVTDAQVVDDDVFITRSNIPNLFENE